MSKGKSLHYDLQERITRMVAAGVGKSKHAEKQQYGNHGRPDVIHSVKTAEAYRQSMDEFARWAKDHGVNRFNKVTQDLAGKYLQERRDAGMSAYTIKKDMAAINKVCNFEIRAADYGLPERSLIGITRSRSGQPYTEAQQRNNEKQILIAESFGVRRQSMLVISREDFYTKGNGLFLAVVEKGGRFRYIECLQDRKAAVLDLLGPGVRERSEHLQKQDFQHQGQPLFDHYDRNIDNHSLRSRYAVNKYDELRRIGLSDQDAKVALTQNLGHNRTSVLAHYLR